jgi:hypothetical protein
MQGEELARHLIDHGQNADAATNWRPLRNQVRAPFFVHAHVLAQWRSLPLSWVWPSTYTFRRNGSE